MKLTCTLDKLCLVFTPSGSNVLKMEHLNSDGESETLTRIVPVDKLITEVFTHLGFERDSKFNSYMRSQYSLENGFTGKIYRQTGVFEFSGKACLSPNLYENVAKVLRFCEKNSGTTPYVSQAHLAFTGPITKDFSRYIKRLQRDWNPKSLLVRTYQRNGQLETLSASSGVFELCVYDKSKELKKRSARNVDIANSRREYVRLFEERYGTVDSQTRVEFRLRSKEALGTFSVLLLEEKWKEAKLELLEQGLRRIGLPKALEKALRKTLEVS